MKNQFNAQAGEFEDENKTGYGKDFMRMVSCMMMVNISTTKKNGEWKTFDASGALVKKKFYKET